MKAKTLIVLTLLAILLLSTFACGGGGPSPAAMEVTSVSVTPTEVGIEEEATVTVQIANTGGTAGTYTVELAVEDTIIQTKDVLVPPESTRKVRFQLSEEQPGTYQVAAGELTTTLSVKAGFYRNTTYGFAIEHPDDWVSEETGGRAPVVEIADPTGFPVFRVFLEVLAEEMSPEEYATTFRDEVMAEWSGFGVVSQGEVVLGDSTSGYEIVFDTRQNGGQTRGEGVFVIRGTQVFTVWRHYDRPSFNVTKDEMDAIFQTFRVEEPRPFGVLRSESLFLFDIGPRTLDPALAIETTSMSYIVQIFSGLVTFDQDMELVPDIAESWKVKGGGTVYTFQLRDGVTFHDGTAVTASDFKYSMERACDHETDSPTAETYLADIVGATEMLDGEATEISGIRVVDDHTLEITIDAPKAYFLYKLAHPVAFVVDRDNVESGDDWWEKPNGTGPLRLEEWQEDELIILESNDAFYDTPPQVENVVFSLWGGNPMLMYESGEIDTTYVYLDDLERVLDPTNPLHQELVTAPQFTLWYIGFNCTKPPFDDPKVRQAFSHAVDKDKIIEVLLKGSVERADGILPPGMPGYNEDLQGLTYDPERARQLIAESSYGSVSNLPPITFTTSGRGTVSDLDAALIDMWRDSLGVEVQVRQLDPDIYYYVLMEEKDEIYDSGWSADYPDPQNFVDILFHSGGEENSGEYSNLDVDLLLEQAQVEQDDSARMEMYHQVEQMLVDDAACLPLYFDMDYILVKPYVSGYILTPLGETMLRYVSIEPH